MSISYFIVIDFSPELFLTCLALSNLKYHCLYFMLECFLSVVSLLFNFKIELVCQG